MKKILLIAITLLTVSTILLMFTKSVLERSSKEAKAPKNIPVRYRIPETRPILEAITDSNDRIFYRTDKHIVVFNTKERQFSYKRELGVNEQVSIWEENSNITICTWLNKEKLSPEEIGTEIHILNSSLQILTQVETIPTLKIDFCSIDTLLLSEAFPFMEEQKYTLYLDSHNLSEGWKRDIQDRLKKEYTSKTEIDSEGSIWITINE